MEKCPSVLETLVSNWRRSLLETETLRLGNGDTPFGKRRRTVWETEAHRLGNGGAPFGNGGAPFGKQRRSVWKRRCSVWKRRCSVWKRRRSVWNQRDPVCHRRRSLRSRYPVDIEPKDSNIEGNLPDSQMTQMTHIDAD